MVDGVTSPVSAPANQAGHGAASSSTDSEAQGFDKAKQSAIAEKPTSAAAQPALKQMTPADFLTALGTLRTSMGEQEFAQLIGRHEDLVDRYLGPFGFQGCWSKSSDYIKDFDAAMAKAGYDIPALQMSARPRDFGTYTGPPQTSMSAVEPGQRFSRYSVYQEFQMKMDNLQGAGPGIIPAGVLLITGSGQEAADKALEQSQAVGGLATAMGGTYQAKSAMPYNQEVDNRDRITPATMIKADRATPAPTPGPTAPAVNTQTTAPTAKTTPPPAATTNQTATPPPAAKATTSPPTTSTPGGAAGTGGGSTPPTPATQSRDARNPVAGKRLQSGPGTVSPSSSNSPTATASPVYKISTNPSNVDWRGSGKTVDDAINEAFKQTGVPIEKFRETKWVKTEYGKTVPVEWTGPGGAQVAIDLQHKSPSPDIPHVNWQGPGKGAPNGHIFLDQTPYGRPLDRDE